MGTDTQLDIHKAVVVRMLTSCIHTHPANGHRCTPVLCCLHRKSTQYNRVPAENGTCLFAVAHVCTYNHGMCVELNGVEVDPCFLRRSFCTQARCTMMSQQALGSTHGKPIRFVGRENMNSPTWLGGETLASTVCIAGYCVARGCVLHLNASS